MTDWMVGPAKRISGRLRVPGDKSISHRAAMLAALAGGESSVAGFLASEDCLNTLSAMEALGASVGRVGDRILIRGTGGRLRPPSVPILDMGNSGTGIRLLCGLLAGQEFEAVLSGDESLRSRPMRRIQDPLTRMGAKVELTGEKGTAPVRIRGGRLKAIDYIPPVASAQVKSCVLLAGLFAGGRTTVRELRATRDHTERMLSAAGAQVNTEGLAVSIEGAGQGRPDLRPLRMAVPGDFSSAAFWLVAAACRPGDRVVVEGVGLNPRRTALLDVLRRMGAVVDARMEGEDGGEPFGCVTVEGARLKGTVVGGDEIPNLIDELPAIAVAGALADGETVIRDAAELRVKESDRISTMARNLRALGVGVREMDDGMVVQGGASVSGGRVGSMGDHRIAMSFAVLAIHSRAAITIENVDCVATSYPGFMDHLLQLSGTPG